MDRFFEIMENIYGVRGLILGIEDAEFEVYSGYCNESAQAMHDGLRKFIRSKNYGEVVLLWQNHFERKEYYWLLNGFSQQDNPTMYKAMSDARALVWHEIHTHLSWRHTQLCVQSHKSTSVKLLEEFNELLGVASIFLDTDFFKHVYVSLLETFGPHIRALSEEKPAEFTALMERFVLEKTDVLDDGKSESEE